MPRDWKDKGRQRVKDASAGNLWKPSEGQNLFRFLPNKKGMDYAPYMDWGLHRDVGPDQALLRCGRDVVGKCWLCEKLAEVAKRDPSKRNLVEKWSRQDMLVAQISPIDLETHHYSEPKGWWTKVGGKRSMGMRIISFLSMTQREYDHPAKGFNVSMTRTGTGLDTDYGAFEPDADASKITKAVFDAIKPLEDLIPAYDEEDQQAAYYGKPRRDRRGTRMEDSTTEETVEDDDVPFEQEAEETVEDDWAEEQVETEATEDDEAAAGDDEFFGTEPMAETEGAPESVEGEDWEWDSEPEPAPPHKPASKPPARPPAHKPAPPSRGKPPAKHAAPPARRARRK